MSKTKENFVYTEEVTGEIVNIPIELLHSHHQNPRKELGDLSELTDSIKKNGIFQNLTVVPYWFEMTGVGCDSPEQQAEMGYLVVIGNRRLEASKQAGLKTLPCIISDMSIKDQISTMLVENMQRSDLTIYEQAMGFQMMLDLGDSVLEISEKSGFSESTVRRRIKLTELDADKLKDACAKQVSMADFEKLNGIEDINTRNKILNSIGTSNFEFEVNRAVKQEKEEKVKNKIREILTNKGLTEIKCEDIYRNKYVTSEHGYYISFGDVVDSEDFDIKDAEVFAFSYGSLYLRKSAPEQETTKGPSEEELRQQAETEEKINGLKELSKIFYSLRKAFVDNLSELTAKKNLIHIVAFIIYTNSIDVYYPDEEDFRNAFSLPEDDEDGNITFRYSDVLEKIKGQESKAILKLAYTYFNDHDETRYSNKWFGWFEGSKMLDCLYELLIKLGYEMSVEEKQWRDGTHPFYIQKKE